MLGRYSFDFDDSDEGTSSSLPRKAVPSSVPPMVPTRTSSIKRPTNSNPIPPASHHRVILTSFAIKFIRRSPPVKSLWLITLVVCSALSGFHLWRLVSIFNSGHTVLAQAGRQPFIFPDITFCPPSAFFRRSILKNNKLHNTNRSLTINILSETLPFLWKYILYDDISMQNLSQTQKEYTSRLALQSIHRHYINSSAVLTALDLVAYCRYQAELCSMDNFVTFYHSVYGACITYRPPKRALHHSYFDNDKPGLVIQFHTLTPGEWFLTADSETSMTHRDAFAVTLHPPMTWPTFQEVSFVNSQRITSIRVAMSQIWRTSLYEDHRLDHQKYNNLLNGVLYCFGGSQNKCQQYNSQFADRLDVLRQGELLTSCDCVSDTLPIPTNLSYIPSCVGIRDLELLLFDHRQVNMVGKYLYFKDMKGEIRWIEDTHDFRKFKAALNCFLKVYPKSISKEKLQLLRPDPVTTLYSQQVDSGPWFQSAESLQAGYIARNMILFSKEVTEPAAKRLNVSLPVQKYLKDLMKIELTIHAYKILQRMTGMLEIRPTAFTGQQLEEVWLYPLSQFLADAGGCAGLLLGVSLVSLLETLDALLLFLYSGQTKTPKRQQRDCSNCSSRYRRPCRRCDTSLT